VFEFAWPWLALLLPLPVLVWRLSRPAAAAEPRERRVTLLHPALRELDAAFSTRRPSGLRRAGVRPWLLALAWVALVVALMRPQWLEPHSETRTEGYDLMLAVDASHSMDALDFASEGQQVTRMSVVKGVMGRFLEQRAGDRIGLIVFGSQAFVLSPLTLDRDAVRSLLDDLVTSIAGQGTAIGDALGVGVKRLRHRAEGSRVLVLITDGENTAGTIPPLEAAQLAAREGVRIYVIGVGSNQEEVSIIEDGRVVRTHCARSHASPMAPTSAQPTRRRSSRSRRASTSSRRARRRRAPCSSRSPCSAGRSGSRWRRCSRSGCCPAP